MGFRQDYSDAVYAQDCTRLHKIAQDSPNGAQGCTGIFHLTCLFHAHDLFHHMEKLSLEDNANEDSELDAAFVQYANHESVDRLSLYDIERQILCLYDQLIELRLERAILETQLELPPGTRQFYAYQEHLNSLPTIVEDFQLDEHDELGLQNAERACLEARAKYILNKSIVEKVLITDPVLKAIHAGSNATPAERLSCVSR